MSDLKITGLEITCANAGQSSVEPSPVALYGAERTLMYPHCAATSSSVGCGGGNLWAVECRGGGSGAADERSGEPAATATATATKMTKYAKQACEGIWCDERGRRRLVCGGYSLQSVLANNTNILEQNGIAAGQDVGAEFSL